MKVGELRVLHEEELDTRLKAARRELYELRFKDAVGQLDNKSQIAHVRHDIARILTVLNERVLGISVIEEAPELGEASAPKKAKPKRKEFVDEDDEEQPVEAGEEATEVVAEAEAEPAPEEKPKRARRAKAEKE